MSFAAHLWHSGERWSGHPGPDSDGQGLEAGKWCSSGYHRAHWGPLRSSLGALSILLGTHFVDPQKL